MSDITKCDNDNCPMAKDCYRHEATSSHWQARMSCEPEEAGKCEHFIKIRKESK